MLRIQMRVINSSEARNNLGEFFGTKQLRETLKTAPEDSAQSVLDHLINAFSHFTKDQKALHDDLTCIVLKRL